MEWVVWQCDASNNFPQTEGQMLFYVGDVTIISFQHDCMYIRRAVICVETYVPYFPIEDGYSYSCQERVTAGCTWCPEKRGWCQYHWQSMIYLHTLTFAIQVVFEVVISWKYTIALFHSLHALSAQSWSMVVLLEESDPLYWKCKNDKVQMMLCKS